MDICDKIDMYLMESIEENKIFKTFKEASDYLDNNFDGHGKILHWPSKDYIRGCKCLHKTSQIVYSEENPESPW